MNEKRGGYARLMFDVSLMTEEQQQALYEAERALQLAGIVFDVNEGKGTRNWELDWSLTGATVNINDYSCSYRECLRVLDSVCLWAVFEVPSSRKVFYFPYCSHEHLVLGVREEQETLGWRNLICL